MAMRGKGTVGELYELRERMLRLEQHVANLETALHTWERSTIACLKELREAVTEINPKGAHRRGWVRYRIQTQPEEPKP